MSQSGVIGLDETHAAFQKPARKQHLAALFGVAVHFSNVAGFACNVERVGRFDLHAEGRFEGSDAAFEKRVVIVLRIEFTIQVAEHVKLAALFAQGCRAAADVFEHRRELGILRRDGGALAPSGQEAAGPLFVAAGRFSAGRERDERGKVLVLRAQSVDGPGAEAGAHLDGISAVHHQLSEFMNAAGGGHAADDAEFIGVLGQVRKKLADLHAALAMLRKLESAALEFAAEAAHTGGGLGGILFEFGCDFFNQAAVIFVEHRLWVERVDLRMGRLRRRCGRCVLLWARSAARVRRVARRSLIPPSLWARTRVHRGARRGRARPCPCRSARGNRGGSPQRGCGNRAGVS